MEEALRSIEKHAGQLRHSPGEWHWHVAQIIAEIPSGYLATYGRIAEITNRRFGHNIGARNVAWLRRHLYGLWPPITQLPLHRVAKAGDVQSLEDSKKTKKRNDRLRRREGSLARPVWWHPQT